MDNTIAYNDAQDWLVRNGYEYKDNYQSINGKTYFEYRSNSGLIYRLPTADNFDLCEQELFRNYIKGHTNMKTTFTLQDILSIKKDNWLKFIKKHMTDDQIKSMEEGNNDWHERSLNGRRELDKYRVFTGNYYNYADGEQSSKTIYLDFYKDLLFIDASCLHDNWCEYHANEMESCPESGLLELMKIINQLVIVLYNLDAGDPLSIANKVVEMLNELINNQTQGK